LHTCTCTFTCTCTCTYMNTHTHIHWYATPHKAHSTQAFLASTRTRTRTCTNTLSHTHTYIGDLLLCESDLLHPLSHIYIGALTLTLHIPRKHTLPTHVHEHVHVHVQVYTHSPIHTHRNWCTATCGRISANLISCTLSLSRMHTHTHPRTHIHTTIGALPLANFFHTHTHTPSYTLWGTVSC